MATELDRRSVWLRRDLFRSQRRNGDDEGFAITALLSVADGRAAAMSWWDAYDLVS